MLWLVATSVSVSASESVYFTWLLMTFVLSNCLKEKRFLQKKM